MSSYVTGRVNSPARTNRLFAAVAMVAGMAYAAPASAAVNCLPVSFVEVSLRSFQINCVNGDDDGNGGVPTWVMFSAGTDNSLAARFQAVAMAAILAGRSFRVNVGFTTTGLCSGVGNDCAVATWWALWPA